MNRFPTLYHRWQASWASATRYVFTTVPGTCTRNNALQKKPLNKNHAAIERSVSAHHSSFIHIFKVTDYTYEFLSIDFHIGYPNKI